MITTIREWWEGLGARFRYLTVTHEQELVSATHTAATSGQLATSLLAAHGQLATSLLAAHATNLSRQEKERPVRVSSPPPSPQTHRHPGPVLRVERVQTGTTSTQAR